MMILDSGLLFLGHPVCLRIAEPKPYAPGQLAIDWLSV